ncbi:MAG: hypothetical protein R2883_02660 [Caldisericia bacterium]
MYRKTANYSRNIKTDKTTLITSFFSMVPPNSNNIILMSKQFVKISNSQTKISQHMDTKRFTKQIGEAGTLLNKKKWWT